MKHYQHLFFDLDQTLWDSIKSSKQILYEIYLQYKLDRYYMDFIVFYERFVRINNRLWRAYYRREVDQNTLSYLRFHKTLSEADYDNLEVAKKMSEDYWALQVQRVILYPNAIFTLEQLLEKNYRLHIITNGFANIQFQKLKNFRLIPYFQEIITPEAVDACKPDPLIFEYALKCSNASKNSSIMIGDDLEIDIQGAIDFGMDAIYFNPEKKESSHRATFEINNLEELLPILS